MNNKRKARIAPCDLILADDHVLFRKGLKRFLDNKKGLRVVGEANDGLELVDLLKKIHPRIVVLDISMPNMTGLEAAREISARYPDVGIFILTMHKNPEYVRQAVSAGASGYLLKDDIDTHLLSAINSIRGGGVYFPKGYL